MKCCLSNPSKNEEAAQEINPAPLPWGGGKLLSLFLIS
jgi:hypothetical protein